MEQQFDGTDSLLFMNTNISSDTGILHDIPTARFKPKTKSFGKYRRLWILVMEFLTPYEIMKLRRVSKLIYLVTFQQEVWRSVVRNYYLICFNSDISFSVRKNRLIVKKLRYSFWQSYTEANQAMFTIKEQEFKVCEDLSFRQLIQIQENYRDICYAIMTFNCIGCRVYHGNLISMKELFYYTSLGGYLCDFCIKLQKYRLLTECEACFENGISASQFVSLNLDDEQGRYFDVLIKARLYMLKINLPIPPRRISKDEPRKELQDKPFKQIKDRGRRYQKDIRNPKQPTLKQHKKGR
jgi:hypothetical protein